MSNQVTKSNDNTYSTTKSKLKNNPDDDEEDDNDNYDYFSNLFVNKEYSTISITIPCFYNDYNQIQQHEEDHFKIIPHTESDSDSVINNKLHDSITLELSCSKAASTDYDLTGQIVWPVSVLLSHYLVSQQGQRLIRGRNVIELGAGCGLPGLAASYFAKDVMLTDGNDTVMELLQRNCDSILYSQQQQRLDTIHNDDSTKNITTTYNNNHHTTTTATISVSKLIWGKIDQIHKIQQQINPIDIVIAADVVQWPAVVEPLLHTIKALLWSQSRIVHGKGESSILNPTNTTHDDDFKNKNKNKPYPSPSSCCCCILGIVDRASSTTNLFFTMAKELGFEYKLIPYSDYFPNNNGHGVDIPQSCREYGGRVAQVYVLWLVDFREYPVLLPPIRGPASILNDGSIKVEDGESSVGSIKVLGEGDGSSSNNKFQRQIEDMIVGKDYKNSFTLPF